MTKLGREGVGYFPFTVIFSVPSPCPTNYSLINERTPVTMSAFQVQTLWKGVESLILISALSKLIVPVAIVYAINRFLNRWSAQEGLLPDDTWDWEKEIVLITGGSSGMGKAMVQIFAEKNIKVVLLDLNPPSGPLPPSVSFFEVDVTSPSALKKASEQIRRRVGDPTVLINNAGVSSGASILASSEAEVRQTFEVNNMAHFWIVQEFLPAMIKANHGHVVTMASISSFVVIANNVDYSCTKAGALAFHEGLGQELKHRYSAARIRTTVVHPTWVSTPMNSWLRASPTFKEHVIEPEEVASAVVKQVLKGKSGQIILPRWQSITSGIRGFPFWLQEYIRDSQADIVMKPN
ncbi:short chain dehydrogenase/reductase [Dactylonectria estremocensis]|uniref:Short-chain dehydrogenase/reductase 3 n=1 Tax=Dactylonectria estremocensis TaxID=1079267 RepID=A0A9P9E9I3_9HYPO|nr:short chain dehydrogenase/reductase [Dactylonectria estremocensis]